MSGYKHGGWINDRHLYGVWTSMLSRCRNTNHRQYKDYGGRGITVCKEWKDFAVFREWAYSNGYVDGENKFKCTIDRIDVNGDYEPSNCRWIPQEEQHSSTRSNRFVEYRGERYTLTQLARKIGMNKTTLKERLNMGWTVEEAVNRPIRLRTKGYRKSKCENEKGR